MQRIHGQYELMIMNWAATQQILFDYSLGIRTQIEHKSENKAEAVPNKSFPPVEISCSPLRGL